MKLTIVTINYNDAEGLKKTLDSVAAQTYTGFEHIIVDGASTDGSVDVIREYESTLASNLSPLASNLKWISEKDKGIYNAMNKGIEIALGRRIVDAFNRSELVEDKHDEIDQPKGTEVENKNIEMATGEYLLFLNSGDYFVDESVLENVFANDCTADILCTRCNVSDKGKVVWTTNPPEDVTFGTLYFTGLAHQSTFIRKSLFEQYGNYDESFRYNADIEFWYRTIIEHGVSTQKIDVITTDYNLDGISSTENKTDAYKLEKERILAPYNSFRPDYDNIMRERIKYASIAWVLNRPKLLKLLDLYRRILKHI